MKTLRLNLFFALMILLLPQLSQATQHPDDPSAELRTSIMKMLQKCTITDSIDENVRISFFVTSNTKVIVLKTDARTESLDTFIKDRINYRKINVKDLETNRIFHMKVHFVLN